MPDVVFYVLIGATAGYVLIQLMDAVGWHRVVRASRRSRHDTNESDADAQLPTVSVIVPARNEADSIEACLTSILDSDYPADRFNVFVVDDGSTDATAAIVERLARRTEATPVGVEAGPNETDRDETGDDAAPYVQLLRVDASDADTSHKGVALQHGIDASTGEIILTTDADCTVGPQWMRTMARGCTPETPFVSGPVRLQWTERWFERYQALEMTVLVAFGGGSIGAGYPTICNGANVALHRSLLDGYDARGSFAADELLLQHVAYDTPQSVAFEASLDAVVDTRPVDTVAEYLRQRARWASTGARYPHAVPLAIAGFGWIVHLLLFVTCAVAVVLPAWRQPALAALLAKMAADGLLVAPAARHLGHDGLMRSFVPASLLWVPSAVVAGLNGMLGSVTWKGRQVS